MTFDNNLPADQQEVNERCACGLHWAHTGRHAPEEVLNEDGEDRLIQKII